MINYESPVKLLPSIHSFHDSYISLGNEDNRQMSLCKNQHNFVTVCENGKQLEWEGKPTVNQMMSFYRMLFAELDTPFSNVKFRDRVSHYCVPSVILNRIHLTLNKFNCFSKCRGDYMEVGMLGSKVYPLSPSLYVHPQRDNYDFPSIMELTLGKEPLPYHINGNIHSTEISIKKGQSGYQCCIIVESYDKKAIHQVVKNLINQECMNDDGSNFSIPVLITVQGKFPLKGRVVSNGDAVNVKTGPICFLEIPGRFYHEPWNN